MTATNQLLMNLILYGLLPLWGIAGFIDWCCHRATRVERTSGLKESLIHSLMGVQLGIPIILCLLFEVNVLVLLICILMWLMHEVRRALGRALRHAVAAYLDLGGACA